MTSIVPPSKFNFPVYSDSSSLNNSILVAQATSRVVWNLSSKELDSLPQSFYELTSLQVLHLCDNKFQSFPSSLGNLTLLNVLDISRNQLNSIPQEISSLKNLTALYLYNNSLTNLPQSFKELTSLVHFGIGCNRLGKVSEEIFSLTNLQTLSLCANMLQTNTTFHLSTNLNFSSLQRLTTLNLSMNNITHIPQGVSLPPSLTLLNLSTNSINDIHSSFFSSLPSLTHLDLTHNKLHIIPSTIHTLSSITTLLIPHNNLSTLPPDLGALPTLTTLVIDNNPLPQNLLHCYHDFKLKDFLYHLRTSYSHGWSFPITSSPNPSPSLSENKEGNLGLTASPPVNVNNPLLPSHSSSPSNPLVPSKNRSNIPDHEIEKVNNNSNNNNSNNNNNNNNNKVEGGRIVRSPSAPFLNPQKLLQRQIETHELTKLTNLDTKDLDTLFNRTKGQDENLMDLERFQQFMYAAGYVVAKAGDPVLLDKVFAIFDLNRNGSIDRKELIVGLHILAVGSLVQRLKLGFQLYDENNDNSIERHELREMLERVGALTEKGNETGVSHEEKINQFLHKVYLGKSLLTFDDFVEHASRDSFIAQLFALDSLFKKETKPPNSFDEKGPKRGRFKDLPLA